MIRFLEFFTRFIANIEITMFPLSISLIIAIVFYKTNMGLKGLIIAILIVIIGLLIGIFLAIRINRKGKSLDVISRNSASPDLNNLKEENE
ncbi:MAG: hypothetical protein ACOVO1_04300 [Chitinophagaceae bacterium]